ncbi:MAG: hypothetical protein Q7T03_07410, partial [Deltaproteobacteria bacterium]|nr:hypothetical protein [Deltaproteobacteria bacterium]
MKKYLCVASIVTLLLYAGCEKKVFETTQLSDEQMQAFLKQVGSINSGQPQEAASPTLSPSEVGGTVSLPPPSEEAVATQPIKPDVAPPTPAEDAVPAGPSQQPPRVTFWQDGNLLGSDPIVLELVGEVNSTFFRGFTLKAHDLDDDFISLDERAGDIVISPAVVEPNVLALVMLGGATCPPLNAECSFPF